MTTGFFGVEAFGEDISMTTKTGQTYKTKPGSGVPKGSFLISTGTGLGLMLIDAIAAKLAGGRPVKVMFTNYNATGGS